MTKIKRIFIDSDSIDDSELRTAQRTLYRIKENVSEDVFDELVDFAWHHADEAWEAVKSADEIYANSSLIPLAGYGNYTGSVVVMDVMMEKALKEDIKGKSIYFMRPYEDIEWDGIDLELFDKAFRYNFIYTLEDHDHFEQVDIDRVLRENKR